MRVLRAVHTKNDNYDDKFNESDVSNHTGERLRSVNRSSKQMLHAPAVSAAYQ